MGIYEILGFISPLTILGLSRGLVFGFPSSAVTKNVGYFALSRSYEYRDSIKYSSGSVQRSIVDHTKEEEEGELFLRHPLAH